MQRRTLFVQAADQKIQNIQALRKKFETARTPVIRENVNKLTAVATADMKFLNDVVTELDTFHKSMFESFGNKRAVVTKEPAEEDPENIFKE